jgi:hypothetical protein
MPLYQLDTKRTLFVFFMTFFHRYTFPFSCGALPEELASQAAYLIDRCYDVTASVFPEAVRISGHK